MDWARLLHCNLGWSCEHFDHHICIFSKMWLFWCHKTICREFAPRFQFPQCAISSTNCPLIKICCDFPLFDHPEGSVPRWPLVLVTHRPPLGLMLSRWEACHLWPRSGRDAVTTAKKKKTKEKNSANWPKAGHTHFSTECLIRPKECRPFLPQVKSLTGKAFDPASPGWFPGSGLIWILILILKSKVATTWWKITAANKSTSSLLVHFSEPPSHADTKNMTSAGPTSPLHYSGT